MNNTCRKIICCLFYSRKSIDVEEVTIDPEAKWTYSEKKEGTIKPDPEGVSYMLHNYHTHSNLYPLQTRLNLFMNYCSAVNLQLLTYLGSIMAQKLLRVWYHIPSHEYVISVTSRLLSLLLYVYSGP